MYIGRWRHLQGDFVACLSIETRGVEDKTITVLRIEQSAKQIA
jgi:hypothetical protein